MIHTAGGTKLRLKMDLSSASIITIDVTNFSVQGFQCCTKLSRGLLRSAVGWNHLFLWPLHWLNFFVALIDKQTYSMFSVLSLSIYVHASCTHVLQGKEKKMVLYMKICYIRSSAKRVKTRGEFVTSEISLVISKIFFVIPEILFVIPEISFIISDRPTDQPLNLHSLYPMFFGPEILLASHPSTFAGVMSPRHPQMLKIHEHLLPPNTDTPEVVHSKHALPTDPADKRHRL